MTQWERISQMSSKWNPSPEQGCVLSAKPFHPHTRRTNFSKFKASVFVDGDIHPKITEQEGELPRSCSAIVCWQCAHLKLVQESVSEMVLCGGREDMVVSCSTNPPWRLWDDKEQGELLEEKHRIIWVRRDPPRLAVKPARPSPPLNHGPK